MNQARTVVFIESASAMGGVQFSTLYLAQSLNQNEWKPLVICPEEGDLTRACREAGIESCVVKRPRLWATSVRIGGRIRLPNPFAWLWNLVAVWRAARRLRRFLHQSSPSVVVTKGLASHFVGGLAARRLRIRCVWHVQDLISERSFGIYRRILSFAARRLPQHVIVDGAAIKQQLPAAIHSRVSVVHNGVDTSIFRPGLNSSDIRRELGIGAEQFVIGHAARMTPWKGQHYLIEAFAKIADKHPTALLLLVGAPVFDHDGYERRLKSMATEFGLEDRIKFTGFRHDLPNVLAAMNVFAFTSIEKDTSPLALLSAMASGLPIVAFDIQGVRELDETGKAFALAPVCNVASLAEALSLLLGDESLRSQLAQNARRIAETQFSLLEYVARIELVLDDTCEANSTSHAARENFLPETNPDAGRNRAVSAVSS